MVIVEYYVIMAVIVAVAAIAIVLYRKRSKKEAKEVPQGIQVFNSSGELIFDLSNATTYVLGTGSTGTSNGSLSNSKIKAGRTWVVVTSAAADAFIPRFTVANGKISWDFYMSASISAVHKRNITFMYGVF